MKSIHKFDLDSSPLFKSFEGLYIGDAVYSKEFGLGHVCGFYEEEIVVRFPNAKKRFSVEDGEIHQIPDDYFVGRSKKVKVFYEGKEISYADYRKKAGLTRKKIKEEKQKYVTLKEATDILGISKAELFKSIAMNNIQTKTFGRSVMIHRDDFLRLYKRSGREK